MQEEFWYVLIYHNCPYITPELRTQIADIIEWIKPNFQNPNQFPSQIATKLIYDFLKQQSDQGTKPQNSLFNWKGIKDFGDQITFRTYHRTIFKKYRKNSNYLFASIN